MFLFPPYRERRKPEVALDQDVARMRSDLLARKDEIQDLQRRVHRVEILLQNMAREDEPNESGTQALGDAPH